MTVELLRSFFGWVAIGNIVLLCVMCMVCLFGRGLIYRLHRRWFGIPEETVNAILYAAMCGYKLVNIAFFIMPYLVLRFFI